jgi:hypothetical protein
MDPISRLSKALAGLRKSGVKKHAGTTSAAESSRGSKASLETQHNTELRADIAVRIAQIDLSQPDQRAAAVRVFVEQVLSREFGHAAVASAAFQQTIGDVQRVMDSDASTRSELDRMLKELAAIKITDQR